MLGEEAYASRPELMAQFHAADHAFTVDPVDGTKNFVKGSPDHAVMVAEVRGGESVRAWIWQPQHEKAYVAERGAGAWRNGERLSRPQPAGDPAEWRGVTSRWRWLGRSLGELRPLKLSWVCCGVDYPHLIEGDADFLLYGRRANPWDHAPGSLLLTRVRRLRRHPRRPALPARRPAGDGRPPGRTARGSRPGDVRPRGGPAREQRVVRDDPALPTRRVGDGIVTSYADRDHSWAPRTTRSWRSEVALVSLAQSTAMIVSTEAMAT